jgi:ribosomal protein S27AE
MNVQKMSCPNCGASISVAEDLNQLNCAFCGSTLSVQRGEGYAALKMAEKLGQAIQDSSAQTQGTIREGTQVTQLELKRLQINQDITTAQLQLSNVQAEIRSLEREKATGTTKQQLRALRQQESEIRSRIMALQAALQPNSSASGIDPTALVPPPVTAKKPWYRSLGWMIVFFLFLTPVWSLLILNDKGQKKAIKIVAAIILVLYVIYFIAVLASGGKQ